MSGLAIHKVLQHIPAFRHLNESECRQLAEIAKERSFEPGQKVLEQGQTSQHLWFVLEGKCQVMRNSGRDDQVELANFEPYSLFGEMSFFSPAPHSATVVAKTPVKLLCIARTDYDDLIHDGVVAAYKLAYNIVESVANRLRRMDEWVTEIDTAAAKPELAAEKQAEWRDFRHKVFQNWNL